MMNTYYMTVTVAGDIVPDYLLRVNKTQIEMSITEITSESTG